MFVCTNEYIINKRNKKHKWNAIKGRNVFEINQLNRYKD